MAAQLVILVVAVGLALLAGYLLKENQKKLAQDDKPTTLATRGSFTTWILGTRRVGPIFTWAGDRRKNKEKAGGKGSLYETPRVDNWNEVGMHVLCVGPAFCLRAIYQHGKIIFRGPITRDSHPSGSLINIGREGAFEIYWGEEDQPVNTFLGASSRIGVSSRWPFICYVLWKDKRLGQQPQWALLDYIIEVDTPDSAALLPSSSPNYEPTRTLTGPIFGIEDFQNGPAYNGSNLATAAYFQVLEWWGEFIKPKTLIEVVGNAESGTFEVALLDTVKIGDQIRSRIYVKGGLSTADGNGTLQTYEDQEDYGYNPAHILAQALFGNWPKGYGLSQSEWNVNSGGDSLDALGVLFESERLDGGPLLGSMIGVDGENFDAIIGGFLQDYGVMLPTNPQTGLIDFVPVRPPASALNIPDDMILPPAPHVESYLGEKRSDRVIFVFSDREVNFRDMTLAIDEDGEAARGDYQRAKRIQIIGTTHYDTASVIAERRSQEELSGAVALRINCSRDARRLKPGDVLAFEGLPSLYRLTAVDIDPLSGKVALDVIPDYYGVDKAQFANRRGNTGGVNKPVEPDAWRLVEIPAYLNTSGVLQVFLARLRAHNQIAGADLYLSDDDVSYTLIDRITDQAAGGPLIADFDATQSNYLPTGPTFNVFGTENDEDDLDALNAITPLTASNWRQGRIVAIIGNEILFVQDIVKVSADVWRMDNVLRARFDTQAVSHPAGTQVYLVDHQNIQTFSDILLTPNATVYTKSAPQSLTGSIPPSAIAALAQTLQGKGVAPIRPWGLKVTSPFPSVFAYSTGDNIDFEWGYRSTETPKTGAGQQPAGTLVMSSAVQGFFELNFDDGSNDFTVQVTSGLTYTLTNAKMIAEFGSEPASMTVTLRNLDGAFKSPPISILVEQL